MTDDKKLIERLLEGANNIINDGTPAQVGPTVEDLRQAAARLEALTAPQGEPVAWQYRYTDPLSGRSVWILDGGLWRGQRAIESRPLYTHSASPAVRVKPLEWVNGAAETPFGAYSVCDYGYSDAEEWRWQFHGYGSDPNVEVHETAEAAKAAAQADYERRVLSALETAPPAETRELVEALNLALEYWRHRQQRYKNRRPAWVIAAEAALAKHGGDRG